MNFRKRFFVLFLALVASHGCLQSSDNDENVPSSCGIGEDCFSRDSSLNVANISRAGGDESHNAGRNCMNCHQEKGPGKGPFVTAGTLFGPSLQAFEGGGSVRLFTDRARTQEVAQFAIDKLGNFYSTETLDIPAAGLYVSVFDAGGQKIQDMNGAKISFACNVCHAGNASLVVGP